MRDTAVLGPLPIPRRAIVRAKFVAVGLFVVGFDVALILAPTVLRIASLPVRLPVTLTGEFDPDAGSRSLRIGGRRLRIRGRAGFA